MIPRVRFSAAARKDVDGYAEHIAGDSPVMARRFVLSTRETADRLRRFPWSGREYVLPRLKMRGVRRYPIDGFPNHLLVYRVAAASIDVLCITHGARNLPRVMRKMLKDPETQEF